MCAQNFISLICHGIEYCFYYTVMEKSFWTPLKFYTISNIIMKYLLKNLFCVSKGVAGLDRHKQIQMIFFLFIVYKKKLNSLQFQYVSSQHCQYQSQQITECVQN